jgi:hypothetical protein
MYLSLFLHDSLNEMRCNVLKYLPNRVDLSSCNFSILIYQCTANPIRTLVIALEQVYIKLPLYNVFLKTRYTLGILIIKKCLLHLNYVRKQITAASWHCHQGQHILPRLLILETTNTVIFGIYVGNYIQLQLELLFGKTLHMSPKIRKTNVLWPWDLPVRYMKGT